MSGVGEPGKCAVRMVTNIPAVILMVKIVDDGVVKIGVGDKVTRVVIAHRAAHVRCALI